MATVDFTKRFSPSEATRGQFVPIDSSSLVSYTIGDSTGLARGRYAELTYIIGSEPGALNISLSGGTVILPVSTVNINEPLRVENEPGDRLDVTIQEPLSTIRVFVDTTVYNPLMMAPTSVSAVNFANNVTLLEVFNNDNTLPIYVGFNSVAIETLSAQGLPIVAESFYSIDRDTSTVYIGNADPLLSVDVRVVGHYKSLRRFAMSSNYKGPQTSSVNKEKWDSTTTTVNSNSAVWGNNSADIMVIAAASGGWNDTETNMGTVSFSGSTIVNTVTATGEFLTIMVNGSAYAIELNIY